MSAGSSGRAPKPVSRKRVARSAARLAAVQALYQMELTGASWSRVRREFEDHRFGMDLDGVELAEADVDHFRTVLETAVDRQAAIDQATDAVLKEGWPLRRLDPILRALFRAAGAELAALPDVPLAVVINEYVEVAKAFFEGEEPRFANGVLDKLARRLRDDPLGSDPRGAAPRDGTDPRDA